MLSRKLLCGIIFFLAAGVFLFAGPAAARDLSLASPICVGGADSASEAFALEPGDLDCARGRFSKRDHFLRSHVEVERNAKPIASGLFWQTDPALFDSMLLRFTYADGSQRLVDVDPQMAARNWHVRTRFNVPVPETGAMLQSVDVVVERPRTVGTLRDQRLVERQDGFREHYLRSIIYGIVCGLLLVPIFNDFMFFRLLRSRFIIWHALMTVGHLGFIFSTSGLIFHFFPDTPLALRFQLNTATLAFSSVFATFFVLDLIEEGKVSPRLRKIVLGLAGLMAMLKLVGLLDLEALRLTIHSAFIVSLLPLALMVFVVICSALAKNSRAARYLLVAYSGVLVSGTLELLNILGAISPLFPSDDFLFGAMVLLVLGSSAAVGDRFMVLRVERDRARLRAIKLGRMALTDALTGLANRRAFNMVERIEQGQALLVADIDHFKAINDSEGHSVGDAVLVHVASLMRESFATLPGTTIYRLGGEEFAMIFACATDREMRTRAEHLRHVVEGHVVRQGEGLPHATISIGGALGRGRDLMDVFEKADAALYRAKRSGRNCSVFVNEEGEFSVLPADAKAGLT